VKSHLDIEVRWGDLDALNHVNNTVFLRYLEEARIRLFHLFEGAWEDREYSPAVVNVNCNFRQEIRFPAVVTVHIEAFRASERRMLLKHTIVDRDDPETLYADAEITVVWIDSNTRRARPLPKHIASKLPALTDSAALS